jgi:hypothetical protein
MQTRTAQPADVFVTHGQEEALELTRHDNGERLSAELPRDRFDALNRRTGPPHGAQGSGVSEPRDGGQRRRPRLLDLAVQARASWNKLLRARKRSRINDT